MQNGSQGCDGVAQGSRLCECEWEILCAKGTWLCTCVFKLFSQTSRQRSEPGQELIAAMFFLSPSSVSTPTSPHLLPPLLQSFSDILSVLINRNLVTKGFLHVTHVPSIISKPGSGKTLIQLKTASQSHRVWVGGWVHMNWTGPSQTNLWTLEL